MMKIELNVEAINNTQVQKLLGVHIDYKLKFDTHIESLCKRWEKSFMPLPELYSTCLQTKHNY